MGIKNVFKKIWMGVKVAAPYLGLAAGIFGGPVGLALLTIEQLIENAEEVITGDGTGAEKAAMVTEKSLAAMEILTGKNINNPKTRAIVGKITDNVVATKNLTTQIQLLAEDYKKLAKDLKDAIDSAKEPAIDDAP